MRIALPLIVTLLLVETNSVVYAAPADEAPAVEQSQAGAETPSPLNVGVLVGYGRAMGAGTLTTLNPYSLGVGVQADYQLPSSIVLGAGLDQFLGESSSSLDPHNPTLQVETSARYLLAHVRLGYNISFQAMGSRVDLRPSVWLGLAAAFVPPDASALNGLRTAFLVAPGLSFHYAMGANGFYLGEDIRVSLPIGEYTRSAILILFTAGTHV